MYRGAAFFVSQGQALDRFQIGVHFLALAAAFALAVPIGWDREKRARSAGLRTFPLVAMASCGFIQASESLLVHSPDGLAKVIEGLITGIGFIGGGAILKQGTTVQGTATAASLWATGAIGVSVGLGSYDVAVDGGGIHVPDLEAAHAGEGGNRHQGRGRRQVGLNPMDCPPRILRLDFSALSLTLQCNSWRSAFRTIVPDAPPNRHVGGELRAKCWRSIRSSLPRLPAIYLVSVGRRPLLMAGFSDHRKPN